MKQYRVVHYSVDVPGTYPGFDNWELLDIARANFQNAEVEETFRCSSAEADALTNISNVEVQIDPANMITTIFWYEDEGEIPPTIDISDGDTETADRWYDDYREKRSGQ